jgi:hypothetical protein
MKVNVMGSESQSGLHPEPLQDYEARLRCRDGSGRHVLIDSSLLGKPAELAVDPMSGAARIRRLG